MFSLECKLIHISMTMNLGEYPCTWIDMSSLVMSKNSTLGFGCFLGVSQVSNPGASFACLSTLMWLLCANLCV